MLDTPEQIRDVATHAYPLLYSPPGLEGTARIPPGAVTIVMVLVNGAVGDYAAYEAALLGTQLLTPDTLQWVAQHGNKMRFEAAERYFEVARDRYRL